MSEIESTKRVVSVDGLRYGIVCALMEAAPNITMEEASRTVDKLIASCAVDMGEYGTPWSERGDDEIIDNDGDLVGVVEGVGNRRHIVVCVNACAKGGE